MSATFNGDLIFGQGPMRTIEEEFGVGVLVNSRITPTDPTSTPIGLIELSVRVEGRLVESTRGDLDVVISNLRSLLTFPVTTQTLSDGQGREWESMSFIRLELTGPIETGRLASAPFVARFRRFAV